MAYRIKELWETLTEEEQRDFIAFEYPPDEGIYAEYPEIRQDSLKRFYKMIEDNKEDKEHFLLSRLYCFFATYKKDFKRAAYYYNMIPEHMQTEAFLLCFGDLADLFPLTDEEMEELNREIEAAKKPS